MMRSWLYCRAYVVPADPERVALLMGLNEAVGGKPIPDVVHHTDPGGISFQGAFVMAEDYDAAYDEGWKIKFPDWPGIMNDWVVPAMPPNKRIKYNTPLEGKDFE